MADNKETIIIDVQVTDDNTAQRLADIAKGMADLKDEQKKLNAQNKDDAKTLAENRAQYKELAQEKKFYEKQIQAEQAKNKELGDSINALREKLRVLTLQYDSLSKAEREGAKGKQLLDKINDTTDAIKDAEQATQRYQRNVGNYENAVKKALASQGKFGNTIVNFTQNITEMGDTFTTITENTQNVNGAFVGLAKSIKGATLAAAKFLLTPIGAAIAGISIVVAGLVAAFKALSASFQRTETNGDELAKALGGLSAIGNTLMQALEPLAKFMGGIFAKTINKVTDLLIKMGIVKQSAVDDAKELAIAEKELHRVQRDEELILKDYRNEQEKLRQIRDDITKSDEERIDASRRLAEMLNKQEEVQGNVAQKELEYATLLRKTKGDSQDAVDKYTEALTHQKDIEEDIQGQRSEQINAHNSLMKEIRERTQARIEELRVIAETQAAEEAAKQKRITEQGGDLIHVADVERVGFEDSDEDLEDPAQAYLDNIALRLEYEQLGYDQEAELRQKALDQEYEQRRANGENIENLDKEYKHRSEEIDKQANKKKIDAASQTATSLISVMKSVGEIAGAGAEYQKVLAIAETAINSGVAIAKAVPASLDAGFPACIPILAGLIATIAANIANAKSAIQGANVPKPKFANGGLVVGEGSGTSDSIDAKLSNGESVINAKSTRQYAPLLSAINVAGGGVPIGTSTSMRNSQELSDLFRDAVLSTPIYVAVTDINEGQQRVANIIDNANY